MSLYIMINKDGWIKADTDTHFTAATASMHFNGWNNQCYNVVTFYAQTVWLTQLP